MGAEDFVKKMDPKLKKLFLNILSIMMIIVILYGVIISAQIYIETGSVWKIITVNVLVPVVIPLLFIYLAYCILTGKKINPPDNLSGKGKKTEFNIPDVYGVKKNIKKKQEKKEEKKTRYGTWTCPKCNYLAKGEKCNKCGYRRG